MTSAELIVRILDLTGTFVFAISGAVAAVNRRLDLFGILVLSFVAGTFGGIVRDLLIGAVPPAALIDWPILVASLSAGLITFFCYADVNKARRPALLFDAVGLSLFAVTGAHKAITFGLSPVTSAMLGMLTGIGGGIARDVFLREIPQVLRSDLYAVAALAGASVVVLGRSLDLTYAVSALAGAALCFGIRIVAIRYGWHLPTARLSAQERVKSNAPDDATRSEGADQS